MKIFKRKCINPVCSNIFVVKKPRATVVYCSECREKREQLKIQKVEAYKNRTTTRKCYKCEEIIEVKDVHTPNTFICEKCVNDSSRAINKKYLRHCIICGNETLANRLSTLVKCDKCKHLKLTTIFRDDKYFRNCVKCHNEFEVVNQKSRLAVCHDCKHKNDIVRPKFGKKAHFGYYGIASDGHKWNSLNEQDVEEWLIANNIQHKVHPQIAKTPRHADQYIPSKNLYLEIDGLQREKDYEWDGKLSLYKDLNLDMKIIRPVSVHFIENKEQCFKELDVSLSFLKD